MLYEEFVTFVENRDGQLYAHCPFHRDDTPSFTVNQDTNEWYCHSCKRGGAEPEFISLIFDVDKQIARHAINMFVARNKWPFPTQEYIKACQQALQNNKMELDALHSFGITDAIIAKYQLGLDDTRITIPVYSKTGYCVNIRKYLPPHHRAQTKSGSGGAKCLNIRNLGAKRYFPVSAFDPQNKEIYIVEGEKDCLVAISQGYNAVTSTGGSNIPTDEIMLFRNKDVYIMLDNDMVGQKNTNLYCQLLRNVANSIYIVTLPKGCKDYTEYWQQYHIADVSQFTVLYTGKTDSSKETLELTLARSEFVEHLNTWMTLKNMSIIGTEQHIYSIPKKVRVVCVNPRCNKICPLSVGVDNPELTEIEISPRDAVSFVDASDARQDQFVKDMFNCKFVRAEVLEMINAQSFMFQETAAFVDGMDDATSGLCYGLYLYDDYRLKPTAKYNFEACRVTDPRTQKTRYVVRSATKLVTELPVMDAELFQKFRNVAEQYDTAKDFLQHYYNQWMSTLGIEGRLDLFGTLLLVYASVTEIPWNYDTIKGWLDVMIMGDTRTGKSQMAQRFVKRLKMGAYINGENALITGIAGGIQKVGSEWMITWGAIPMNDKGLLFIDEASGLSVEDVKNLSATRSSGAVTLNKIISGEARARTRLVWLSNPRSGRNLDEFYWKGFGAFQEYIPIAEDQARYDLVVTAAREDVEMLEGTDSNEMPIIEDWCNLLSYAWNISSEQIYIDKETQNEVKRQAKELNERYGGGPLVVGVAVHEKILRISCAFAVLMGDIDDAGLHLKSKHVAFASEWLAMCLEKPSLCYSQYIKEKKQAEKKKKENLSWVMAQLNLHPALRSLMASSTFKGFQLGEVLGIDRLESSKLLSELLNRGLVKPTKGGAYIPDKMLLDVARQAANF